MLHQRILGCNFVEHGERLAAGNQVILGNEFKPIDGRIAVQNLAVVLGSKPQSKSERGRARIWCRINNALWCGLGHRQPLEFLIVVNP